MKRAPKIQTVLVNGEHTLLRAFLRAWLGRFNRLRIVAEADNAVHAIAMVQKHKPNLVLMDFDTLQKASLDFLAKIRLSFPKVKVIIYFAYTNDNFAINVIRAGAAGFVLKSAESEDMERAIKTVLNGGVYLSPGFLASIGGPSAPRVVLDRKGEPLTSRQAAIFKLSALGLDPAAVAFELKMDVKDVEAHKKALLTRLGVKSTAALVKTAIRAGLVPA